jgi:hypothetical protein
MITIFPRRYENIAYYYNAAAHFWALDGQTSNDWRIYISGNKTSSRKFVYSSCEYAFIYIELRG